MWIESHQSLGRHPKTKRLARKLGIALPTAIGHLHLLWWWALDYAPDGDITKYDPAEIAEECAWTDDSVMFFQALTYSGFIDQIDGRTVIHDWDDYAGKLIERRATDRERMREHRAKQKLASSERSSYVTGTLPERSPDVLSTVPTVPTVPNQPYQPNQTEPKNALQPAAALSYLGLVDRLKTEANKPVVLADAVRTWYAIDCEDFGRLGDLGKKHGYGEILKVAWDLLPSWNGVDNPLDYITATVTSRKNDRRNGNGHSAEKLPTNHQPKDLPEVINWPQLDADEIKRQEDEKDRLAWERRAAVAK